MSVAALIGPTATTETAQAAPAWEGAVVHANEDLLIPPTPDGRVVRVKVDSADNPGVRMSMIVEDLPPDTET